jgi:hypothetical protein
MTHTWGGGIRRQFRVEQEKQVGEGGRFEMQMIVHFADIGVPAIAMGLELDEYLGDHTEQAGFLG